MQALKRYLGMMLFIFSVMFVQLSAQAVVVHRTIKNVDLTRKSVTPIDFNAGAPTWYDSNIYCVNFNTQSIVVLDAQTAMVKRQIGGKGPGPGEFQSITGFTVDKRGVSVVDGGKISITEFDHQGRMIRLYKHSKQMMTAIRLSAPFQYLIKPVQPLEDYKEQFQIVNIDQQTSQSIYATSKIVLPQSDPIQASLQTIYFEGPMLKNANGYVFRVPWLCGEFIAFDEQSGRVLYGRQTVDKTTVHRDPSTATSREGQSKTVSFSLGNMRRVNLSAAANAQYLFVLSNAASPSIKDFKPNWTDERVVDVYNVKNGDYVFSFLLPKHNGRRAKEFTLTEDVFCVLYDDEIVRYAAHFP
jgi:hypothetical protein